MHPRPFIHGTYYYYYYYYYYYFWLRWVFAAARRLSLVAASGVYSSLQCAGFSLQWFLLLQSPGSRHAGLSSCGLRAQQLWPAGSAAVAAAVAQLLRGMWDLPGPGLEPVSPELAGRLPTTAPPGKPLIIVFLKQNI